jgi:uncharacterized protein YkwD
MIRMLLRIGCSTLVLGAAFSLPVRAAAPDAADVLFAQVNASRVAAGREPLARCPELESAARAFAADLAAKHYFSHTQPNGETLTQRLDAAKVSYRAAAENLALSFDPATAHKQLLASPEHRENLMDPAFHRAGIAAVPVDAQRTVYVEEFAD